MTLQVSNTLMDKLSRLPSNVGHILRTGYQSHSAQRLLESLKEVVKDETATVLGSPSYGINYRTLGNVAYFMCSLNSDRTLIRSVEDRIWTALHIAGR